MAFYILSCGKRRGREGIINYEKKVDPGENYGLVRPRTITRTVKFV
jgi:hypothetical protein